MQLAKESKLLWQRALTTKQITCFLQEWQEGRPTFLFVFCLHASISTQRSLTQGWGTWHGQVLQFQHSSGHSSPCNFSSAIQSQGIKLSQLTKKLDLMTPKQIH